MAAFNPPIMHLPALHLLGTPPGRKRSELRHVRELGPEPSVRKVLNTCLLI